MFTTIANYQIFYAFDLFCAYFFQLAKPNVTNLVQLQIPADGYLISQIQMVFVPSEDMDSVAVSRLVAKACLKPGMLLEI